MRSALDFPAPGDAHPLTHMVSQDGGTLLRLVHVRQTAPVLPAANSNGRTLAMAA